MAMVVVSIQLASFVACREMEPRHHCCPIPTEAPSRIARAGGGIIGCKSVEFRRRIAVKAGSKDLPNAALAEELDLVEVSSSNADGELSEKEKPEADGGRVETWFYGSYKAWPDVHRLLTERIVKGVEWQEAYDLAKSGAAVLIDVRELQEFAKIVRLIFSNLEQERAAEAINEKSNTSSGGHHEFEIHADGSFSAPLFQLIQGNDLQSNLRRLGYALLTDFSGTERNPNFVDQALQAVDGDKQKLVIVICGIGGTLSTFVERQGPKAKKFADPSRRFGRASRSLRAVFELQEAGFEAVSYLSGGLSTWIHEGLPTEGGN